MVERSEPWGFDSFWKEAAMKVMPMLKAGTAGAGDHLTAHKGLAMLEKHAGRIPVDYVSPVFQVRLSSIRLSVYFAYPPGNRRPVRARLSRALARNETPGPRPLVVLKKSPLTRLHHICARRPPSRSWNTPTSGSGRLRRAWSGTCLFRPVLSCRVVASGCWPSLWSARATSLRLWLPF